LSGHLLLFAGGSFENSDALAQLHALAPRVAHAAELLRVRTNITIVSGYGRQHFVVHAICELGDVPSDACDRGDDADDRWQAAPFIIGATPALGSADSPVQV
jgi:hypothetical protein